MAKEKTKTKRSSPTVCVLQKKPWLTWAFAGESVARGGLQAIGTIVVYVLVILWFVKSSDTLREAVAFRMRGVAKTE